MVETVKDEDGGCKQIEIQDRGMAQSRVAMLFMYLCFFFSFFFNHAECSGKGQSRF